MSFNNISVIGLGYIGLPTAAMFASRKKQVIGVDVNQYAVDTINKGEIHIVEPELDIIVHAAVTEGYLKATTTPEEADAFLIAVPTPFKNKAEDDGQIPEPDLTYIQKASEAIAPVLKKGNLVILESTSPVGATEKMAEWLAEARPDLSFPQHIGEDSDIRIAHCPERVLPGHVVRELVENDRVIGGMTNKCSEAAIELYRIFVEGECVKTNSRTAEMAKLTENSCRDVQIAFANELSIICDKLDIDVWELISLANRHPRINILQPGPGVGGHCIAVDPWFIVSKTPEEAKIIHTARQVNDAKPHWVLEKVKIAIADLMQSMPEKTAKDIRISCFGIAFKADIDDLRESPSFEIAKAIAKMHSAPVRIVEPNITELSKDRLENGVLCELHEAIQDTDIAVLLVDHREFKEIKELPSHVKVIDTKGIWS
ncbi:UDP-N-acetyl-D-mannosamine dehydrogenase [Pseudoalteromonas luteoviolacea]|uniref:UDP-N-acetyl-D-mannosamine dehydrogenase n=1 Tax=Pseudoalteromonas luteoviolacea DSM 6061 TaxID=1365250 RepID=A0A166XLI5_9GAMM|nr:UDP-N-acetyl-D-mannosamine dehydrogenase [Pseudoalteromonas luteoviolacea]KZN40515.1 UDP-N-acetyl-D-mannosamine dehydrogenase [Pseudoalteromonas luteoviolacea DSM 6061]KZN59363.1 UDP-N-acetyl-D-mannosamine dehydrogenase [Pseudoalteromonas luteoviolacea CPMOR-2]MBE0387385.1 UDP-N-acetyl-D-mannosaminuronic acid dehydrogenase [Pseudoalteromonas luteoviolacea DSM 6061]TQF72201.1 UDP-N-acetyl-D-mannosamine dehydrogenase [Pseudoalteromonas luteoviolacea]